MKAEFRLMSILAHPDDGWMKTVTDINDKAAHEWARRKQKCAEDTRARAELRSHEVVVGQDRIQVSAQRIHHRIAGGVEQPGKAEHTATEDDPLR